MKLFMLIWCCVAIAIFSGLLVFAGRFAVESAPVIGWGPGVFIVCLSLGFLALWIARLVLVIRSWREA